MTAIDKSKGNYMFTAEWFYLNDQQRQNLIKELSGRKINILEIGVFEGRSTVWMLQNLCTHPESKLVAVDWFEGSVEYNDNYENVENAFMYNISVTGKRSQVIVMKDSSFNSLVKLNNDKKFMFDFIYIDGSHMPNDVLADGVLAWPLLKENGIMIFDDYTWHHFEEDYNKPGIAMDAFVACNACEVEVIERDFQLVLRKVKKERKFTWTESGLNNIKELKEAMRPKKVTITRINGVCRDC